jgi:MoaA/NifB/PqqE/SkfB family radical SAM enzyme
MRYADSRLTSRSLMRQMPKVVNTWRRFHDKSGHRFAVIETNRGCNRHCSYCAVPTNYHREQEATIDETLSTVDWLYDQGYRLLSYLGGEPLAPFTTKEGVTFFDHTLRVCEYATQKGMIVNITTNGDYATKDKIDLLRHTGLDSLTFSLHSYTEPALRNLLRAAQLAAEAHIIPSIQAVLTSKTAEKLPGIAAFVAENGILFSFGIVQEKGGEFSIGQGQQSIVPTIDQQKRTLQALLRLKKLGFVRNNKNYITRATEFYPNNWKCDPERDNFIHIGAGGRVNVCSDVRTNVSIAEIQTLDSSQWRELKRMRVKNCGNCLFHCYYEAQNPDLLGDLPTGIVALLLKTGNARLARRWGEFVIHMLKRRDHTVDWNLNWKH